DERSVHEAKARGWDPERIGPDFQVKTAMDPRLEEALRAEAEAEANRRMAAARPAFVKGRQEKDDRRGEWQRRGDFQRRGRGPWRPPSRGRAYRDQPYENRDRRRPWPDKERQGGGHKQREKKESKPDA